MTAAEGGEFEVIARIRQRFARPGARVEAIPPPAEGEVFSGDDAAVLHVPPGGLLLAIDLVVEGVHIDLSLGSLADTGWKSVAVNASDIAAMGGRPLHIVAGVSAPAGTDLDALADGMAEACAAYGIALVGGDLAGGDRLVVSVAITGTCDDRRPVLRDGASVGDLIWVTGPLGSSAAGLRRLRAAGGGPEADDDGLVGAYRRPVPRLAEGEAAAVAGATAMIDVSDGLSQDLGHIATSSVVGVRLGDVPVAAGATLAEALGGGEDYELVFTAPEQAAVREIFAARSLRPPQVIGVCTAEAAERSLGGRPLEMRGYEHDFGARG